MLQFLGGNMAQGQHFKKLTNSDLESIKIWAKEGFGLTEIANKLENKVSRQRIKQITEKFNINAFANKKIKRQKELNDRMFQKWGPKWNDQEWRKSAIYAAMREKFKNKKAHCYKHEFSINFGDLDYSSSEECTVEVNLRYSFAKYTNLCVPYSDTLPVPTCGAVQGAY